MLKTKTRRKNPGWAEKRLRASAEYGRYECAVGFPRGKGLDNPRRAAKTASGKATAGPSILETAVWNNYGTKEILAHPFMETAAAAIAKEWKAMQAKTLARAKRSGNPVNVKAALEVAGVMGEEKIKDAIGNGGLETNASAGIGRKGSGKRPMDADALRKAATHAVREKGS